MSKISSREVRLVSRPDGVPTAANFELVSTEVGDLQEGQVLVRNDFMSVDPYMRGWMNEVKSYVPPFQIGKALEGGAVGEVIESRSPEFQPGNAVSNEEKLSCSSKKWRLDYKIIMSQPLDTWTKRQNLST